MAVCAVAQLRLYPEDAGGLRTPLQTPTQSLVLRPADRDEVGLVGINHLPDNRPLAADSEIDGEIVFPEAEAGSFVRVGSRFLLWNGRTVGEAEVTTVDVT